MKQETFKERIQNPRRMRALKVRSQIYKLTREFFDQLQFIETPTPLLVKSPGMEPHIRPYQLKTGEYLHTSPEFAMKKILAGGLDKIYQICSVFRAEPFSTTHLPEFTMLEWYRTHSDYAQIMEDVEQWIEKMATSFFGEPTIPFKGEKINVKTPWPKYNIRDLFKTHFQIDIAYADENHLFHLCRERGLIHQSSSDSNLTSQFNPLETTLKLNWDDYFQLLWMNRIEPELPKNQAVFVKLYPPSQAALSEIEVHADGTQWAKRFEFYIGGIEMGNAFQELTNAIEQEKRFIEDMNLREKIYGSSFPKSPIDEEFIRALKEGLPKSAGIAVGLDRMVMLFADEPEIKNTIWIDPYQSFQPE